MTLSFRYFIPPVYLVLGLLVVLTIGACGVNAITAAHRIADLRQQVCRAELRALRAANPFTERYVVPSDPCLALSIVSER